MCSQDRAPLFTVHCLNRTTFECTQQYHSPASSTAFYIVLSTYLDEGSLIPCRSRGRVYGSTIGRGALRCGDITYASPKRLRLSDIAFRTAPSSCTVRYNLQRIAESEGNNSLYSGGKDRTAMRPRVKYLAACTSCCTGMGIVIALQIEPLFGGSQKTYLGKNIDRAHPPYSVVVHLAVPSAGKKKKKSRACVGAGKGKFNLGSVCWSRPPLPTVTSPHARAGVRWLAGIPSRKLSQGQVLFGSRPGSLYMFYTPVGLYNSYYSRLSPTKNFLLA